MKIHGEEDITEGVSSTALVVAAARAIETNHRGGLIKDPYAEHFVHAASGLSVLPTRIEDVQSGDDDLVWGCGGRYFSARTKAFDEHLLAAMGAGIRQIVMIGAGLDTRAWRLPLPADCAVYEIDRAGVQSFKRQVLDELDAKVAVGHCFVPADLAGDWPSALHEAGFAPMLPTVWLAEGLLPYLPAEVETRLFATVDALSARGSFFGFELILDQHTPEVRAAPIYRQTKEKMGVDLLDLFNADPRPDSLRYLHGRGWSITARTPFDYARKYGRGPEVDIEGVFTHYRWTTAVKRGGGTS
jgi:methyltransferase (TIGR00027 family)